MSSLLFAKNNDLITIANLKKFSELFNTERNWSGVDLATPEIVGAMKMADNNEYTWIYDLITDNHYIPGFQFMMPTDTYERVMYRIISKKSNVLVVDFKKYLNFLGLRDFRILVNHKVALDHEFIMFNDFVAFSCYDDVIAENWNKLMHALNGNTERKIHSRKNDKKKGKKTGLEKYVEINFPGEKVYYNKERTECWKLKTIRKVKYIDVDPCNAISEKMSYFVRLMSFPGDVQVVYRFIIPEFTYGYDLDGREFTLIPEFGDKLIHELEEIHRRHRKIFNVDKYNTRDIPTIFRPGNQPEEACTVAAGDESPIFKDKLAELSVKDDSLKDKEEESVEEDGFFIESEEEVEIKEIINPKKQIEIVKSNEEFCGMRALTPSGEPILKSVGVEKIGDKLRVRGKDFCKDQKEVDKVEKIFSEVVNNEKKESVEVDVDMSMGNLNVFNVTNGVMMLPNPKNPTQQFLEYEYVDINDTDLPYEKVKKYSSWFKFQPIKANSFNTSCYYIPGVILAILMVAIYIYIGFFTYCTDDYVMEMITPMKSCHGTVPEYIFILAYLGVVCKIISVIYLFYKYCFYILRWPAKILRVHRRGIRFMCDANHPLRLFNINKFQDFRREMDKTFKITQTEKLIEFQQIYRQDYVYLYEMTPGIYRMLNRDDGQFQMFEGSCSLELLFQLFIPKSLNMNLSAEAIMERLENSGGMAPFANYNKSYEIGENIINHTTEVARHIAMYYRYLERDVSMMNQHFRKGDQIRLGLDLLNVPSSSLDHSV